jgi:hypothetical protein
MDARQLCTHDRKESANANCLATMRAAVHARSAGRRRLREAAGTVDPRSTRPDRGCSDGSCAAGANCGSDVTGTAGNASVNLSWTAPSSNGGSPITGYRITPYIGANAQTPVLTGSAATTFR